jgi:hypothetical protein
LNTESRTATFKGVVSPGRQMAAYVYRGDSLPGLLYCMKIYHAGDDLDPRASSSIKDHQMGLISAPHRRIDAL